MNIKISRIKRKRYMLFARMMFLLFVVVVPLCAWFLIQTLPLDYYYGNFFGFILGLLVISFIPALVVAGGYWLYCSGRSLTNSLSLFDDALLYSYYSGSLGNRTTSIIEVKKFSSYALKKRNFIIEGMFLRDDEGVLKGNKVVKKIKIPRVFEDEEKIIAFLDTHKGQVKMYGTENDKK